jgi:MFS family permease
VTDRTAQDRPEPWYRTVTPAQWKTLLAAKCGWMLDAMDFMLYAMALNRLKDYFRFGDDIAGLLVTVTLLASAAGGVFFGWLADHIGRTRALMATVLVFSFCSLGAATSQGWVQLLLWRALLGIGMGGEWSSGAVLVSETWPPEHRGKAISIMQSGWALGYILAALLAGLFLDVLDLGAEGWRWLFVVGVVPAFFVLWIRREVEEPRVWTNRQRAAVGRVNPFRTLFGPTLRARTLLATLLTTSAQFAYWGLFSWLPSFLSRSVHEGGAGMKLGESVAWIVAVQLGAYLGYLSFGFIAERIGRRPAFVAFLLAAAVLVPVYGQLGPHHAALFALSPLLGFVGHGAFSLFGALLAELFPTAVRATGQGLTYNVGRAFGAVGPFTIGALATHVGLGSALALTSASFAAGAVLIFFLPDTTGQRLDD